MSKFDRRADHYGTDMHLRQEYKLKLGCDAADKPGRSENCALNISKNWSG
jgi:hypothetical protein